MSSSTFASSELGKTASELQKEKVLKNIVSVRILTLMVTCRTWRAMWTTKRLRAWG